MLRRQISSTMSSYANIVSRNESMLANDVKVQNHFEIVQVEGIRDAILRLLRTFEASRMYLRMQQYL